MFYGFSEGNLVFINAFGLPRTAGFTPMPYAICHRCLRHRKRIPLRDMRGFMRRVAVGDAGLLITEVSPTDPNGRAMAQQLLQALPAYAVPLFVSIVKSQEATGTFKLRKVALKQQGLRPGHHR